MRLRASSTPRATSYRMATSAVRRHALTHLTIVPLECPPQAPLSTSGDSGHVTFSAFVMVRALWGTSVHPSDESALTRPHLLRIGTTRAGSLWAEEEAGVTRGRGWRPTTWDRCADQRRRQRPRWPPFIALSRGRRWPLARFSPTMHSRDREVVHTGGGYTYTSYRGVGAC